MYHIDSVNILSQWPLIFLVQAKAFDKKTSVLQYLVKIVKGNEPDLLNVHEEMQSIGPAESVVVETLVSELKELNEQLKKVKVTATAEGKRIRDGILTGPSLTALDRLRQQKTKIKDVEGVNMYNQTEPIHLTAMEKFVLYAEKRTKEAFSRTEEVQENFKGVLTYFGEDPSMTSTDFFGTLNKFVAAFDAALVVVRRIEALNAAEEKMAAAQRAKEDAKSKMKETAIKSLTAKIDRLTAEKESKEKSITPDRGASKKTLNTADSRKEFSEMNTSKGTLDFTGKRKQFADPFAGPDEEAQETKEPSTAESQQAAEKKEFSPTSTKSNGNLGFFPATNPNNKSPDKVDKSDVRSPGIKTKMGFYPATSPRHTIGHSASFDKNSTSGIETSPKYHRATLAAPHMSPFAKGIKHEQLTEQRLHLQHIEMPVFDDESSRGGSATPPPMGIAAMAAAAAQKKQMKAEEKDNASTPPPPMGIAAMAAAAAQKKAKKAEDNDDASTPPLSMGIAAMAAAAAQKKAKKAKEKDDASTPPPPMGIAAMAAAAAQKKAKKAEEKDNSNTSPPPMGIGALAAADAAQKKQMKAEEKDDASTPPPPMGIAAMAAAAAQKKQMKAEEKDDASTPPLPMGIAAMAAAAAQKKAKKAEEKDDASTSPAPMGIGALAAAAAQKKQMEAEDNDGVSSSGGALNIAALAAAAAQKKATARKSVDRESVSPPPMGIAAMAAAAALKKSLRQAGSKENEPSDVDVGSNHGKSTEKELENELLCSACNLSKSSTLFSKTQRSRGASARCKDCIAAAVRTV
jgi:hypothetical protein